MTVVVVGGASVTGTVVASGGAVGSTAVVVDVTAPAGGRVVVALATVARGLVGVTVGAVLAEDAVAAATVVGGTVVGGSVVVVVVVMVASGVTVIAPCMLGWMEQWNGKEEPGFPQPHAHVGFVNSGAVQHNVTFDDGRVQSSPTLNPNQFFDAVITVAGPAPSVPARSPERTRSPRC